MRVSKPKNIHRRNGKSKSAFGLFAGILIIIFIPIVWYIYDKQNDTPLPTNSTVPKNNVSDSDTVKSGKIGNFTADELRDIYNNFAYPNTERINELSSITGNTKADARIRYLAEARGYQLRSAPVTNAFALVNDSNQLQQRAAHDWKKLFNAAKKDKIYLKISEAFRSAEDQKTIFLSRLGNISAERIANGLEDNKINQLLQTTAPPGYSRHHSGYTVDLVCEDQSFLKFEESKCFEWLSKDNYHNAKRHGWIPSYPEGTTMQGPEPESWEYVWVGVEALYK